MTKRRPKDIGTDGERVVARFLQANGFPHAERRALRGTLDAGDITGIPGVCVEVKSGERAKNASDAQIDAWLTETETERQNAHADIGVLVLQRRGVGPSNAGRWWAVMPLYHAVQLVYGRCEADPPYARPVRMLLADAVTLLRTAGYGQALDSEVA